MQCKNIPTEPILNFLLQKKNQDNNKRWGTWFSGFEDSVQLAMPYGVEDRLVLAKMKNLVKKGLVDGCYCGCRGDFEITEKGIEFLLQLALKEFYSNSKLPDWRNTKSSIPDHTWSLEDLIKYEI